MQNVYIWIKHAVSFSFETRVVRSLYGRKKIMFGDRIFGVNLNNEIRWELAGPELGSPVTGYPVQPYLKPNTGIILVMVSWFPGNQNLKEFNIGHCCWFFFFLTTYLKLHCFWTTLYRLREAAEKDIFFVKIRLLLF